MGDARRAAYLIQAADAPEESVVTVLVGTDGVVTAVEVPDKPDLGLLNTDAVGVGHRRRAQL